MAGRATSTNHMSCCINQLKVGIDVRSFSTLRDIMKTLDSNLDLSEDIASF